MPQNRPMKNESEIGGYLRIVLRHDQIDEAERRFAEAIGLIEYQESGAYSACNAGLIAQLIQIDEMEQLNLINLLTVTYQPAACSVLP